MDTNQDRVLVETKQNRRSVIPDRVLRIVALALASVSPLAFVADEKLRIPMAWTVPLVVLPAAVALLMLAVVAARTGASHLAKIISIGLIVGVCATAAYDGFRLAAYASRYTSHDEAAVFGTRILRANGSHEADKMSEHGTDTMADKSADKAANVQGSGWARLCGYLYHYWNGVAFVIAFLLLFARRPWLALPYMGVLVYGGMVLVMGVHGLGDFVLEESGHLAFGTILAGTAWVAFQSPRPVVIPAPTRRRGGRP